MNEVWRGLMCLVLLCLTGSMTVQAQGDNPCLTFQCPSTNKCNVNVLCSNNGVNSLGEPIAVCRADDFICPDPVNPAFVNACEQNNGVAECVSTPITSFAPIILQMSFGAGSIPPGGKTTLTFTLNNPNVGSLWNLNVTDTLPAGLVIAPVDNADLWCATGLDFSAAGNGIIFYGNMGGGATCTFSVIVTADGTATGLLTNNVAGIAAGRSFDEGVPGTQGADIPKITGLPASASIAVYGPVNVGQTQSEIIPFTAPITGTLGTPLVLTDGAPNLDFTLASTTCTGTMTQGNPCTVTVTFAPAAPGLRKGVVELVDNNGNILTTALIYNIGEGPAIALASGVPSTLAVNVAGLGLSAPRGAAVDAASDLFIVDSGNSRVVKIPAGCTSSACQTVVPAAGLIAPFGVAVDGAGNVFISDLIADSVFEVPYLGSGTYGTQTTLPASGLKNPRGLAVDGVGNVFIADFGNSRLLKLPYLGNGAYAPQAPVGTGAYPSEVAVDPAGDLFVAQNAPLVGGEIVEITPGGVQTTLPFLSGTFQVPAGLAVDAAGDVFATDDNNGYATELSPLGNGAYGTQTFLVESNLDAPTGIAVDAAGDVFVVENGLNQLVEFTRSQPPSLSFASTQIGQTSSDSPQSLTVQNIGNQPLSAIAPGLVVTGPNFVQVAGSGMPADCGSGFSLAPLAPGTACNLSVSFAPQSVGPLSSTAVFTDNALNASPSTTQTISLKGTGLPIPPAITSASTAVFTVGVAGSFTVTTTGAPAPSIKEAGALPNGLVFVDNGNGTGTLYGTPLVFVGGNFSISFTANNGAPPAATQAFTIVLRQAPAITSASSATFAYGEPNSFTVTTTGFPPPGIADAGSLPPGVTFTDNHNGTATLAGTPSAGGTFPLVLTATNVVTTATQNFTLNVAGLTISPATLNFGTAYLNGSQTLSVTLTNMTKTTVTISGASVTPGTANATAYKAVSHCGSPLKTGNSCTIAVTFMANALGLQTATLNIADNTPGSPQEVSLSAYVIDPVADFTPSPLSFGTQPVNSSTTLPVQLSNNGQTPLNIGGIAVTGANSGAFFQINSCPAVLAPATSCTISVTFAPTVKGSRSGTLTVTDNVAAGQSTVALTGTAH